MTKSKDNDAAKELGSTPQIYGFQDLGSTPADYVPEGFKDLDAYLQDLRETYQLDSDADRLNREQAAEDKLFAAGEQWDPVVLQHRQGLPCLVINTIPQFTAQLVGDWRSNRSGVKVVPAENGDIDVASVRSDLIRSIEVRSRASRVYDSAFESMIQCGDGAYQIAVEYAGEDVFDQDIVIKPIDDALSVIWDRMSIDPTGRDASHCFVDEIYPRKEYDRLWPDTPDSQLSSKLEKELYSSGWLDNDIARVTAHWRIIVRDRLLMMFENGSIHAVEAEGTDYDELIQTHGNPVRTRMAPCRYAQMHLVTGYKILAGPFEYRLDRLPIIRMTGRVVNVNGRRIRHGLVRQMKDAARMKNFWRSVAAEQLGYSPKAQWLASAESVEGREDDFRKAHLSRDPLLIFNDGTEAPERIPPNPIEAALLNEANVNSQDMKDVTGLHDASLGIKSNETSGRAIMARQREGDVASITYYDNGNAALLEGGDVINQLIGQIYDATRIIRTIGEDETPKLLKINDPTDPESPDLALGKYDVVITTGASYTTRRVEAADAMMQAVQVFPELMQVAGDLVAKAQDWPGAQEIAERLRKTIPPQLLAGEDDAEEEPQGPPPIPPEVQQAMMEGQTQIQELSKENEQLKQKLLVDMQKLKIDEFNAQTKRMEVIGEINVRNKEARAEAAGNLQRISGDKKPQ